jgi:hypothetical protein
MKSKVLKHGKMKRLQGLIFKKYKEYEVFLLENGMILFYSADIKSKTYENEIKNLRL